MLLCDKDGYLRKEFTEVPEPLVDFIDILPKDRRLKPKKKSVDESQSLDTGRDKHLNLNHVFDRPIWKNPCYGVQRNL